MTAQVVEPTRHMDINRPPGEIGAPKTQHQPSFTLPTFRSLNDHSMVHDRNFQRDGAMTGRARHHPGEPGGLAGPRAEKTVSLALQGGGAHGAFTWGVLDALLEDGRLAVEAITGASAGAMNAVVMVEGWLEGGIDGARSQLETFWRRASLDGSLSPAQRGLLSRMLGFWSIQAWTDVIAQSV